MKSLTIIQYFQPNWNQKEDQEVYCWVHGHDESCLCRYKGFKKYGNESNSELNQELMIIQQTRAL